MLTFNDDTERILEDLSSLAIRLRLFSLLSSPARDYGYRREKFFLYLNSPLSLKLLQLY